jgi:hypothetical protein
MEGRMNSATQLDPAISLVAALKSLSVNPKISLVALRAGSGCEEQFILDYMAAAEADQVVKKKDGGYGPYWEVTGDVASWASGDFSARMTIRGKICDYIRRNKGCRKKDLVNLGYNRFTVNNTIKSLSSSGALQHQGGGVYVWNQRVPI